MIKKISLWSRKGGVGKSTLSLNLAAAYSSLNKRVLLLDSDPQASCLFIAKFGNLSFEVADKLPANLSGYDAIIQDCAPSLKQMPIGDVVVMPFCPSGLDIGSTKKFIPQLTNNGKKVIEVVSKVNWQRKQFREFALRCKAEGAFIVKDRSVYIDASNHASTIFDSKFDKSYRVGEARTEVSTILNASLESLA